MNAIARQTRPAEQVVITVRDQDRETLDVVPDLERLLGPALEVIITPEVNLRDSMNIGLARTTGSLVAMTDDDAEPHPEWLAKLAAAFRSSDIGGIGGRDWQPHERWDEPVVGKLSWYGRVVGNHHLGTGQAREVELLKGANCCFRGDVLRRIRFDRRLRGKGNVNHWEMAICFALLREGYKLIYDPAIVVDHHIEQRHDGDINARGGFEYMSYVDGVFNEQISLESHLKSTGRRFVYRAWSLLIGTAASPGLAQVPRRVIKFDEPISEAWRRFKAVRAAARLVRASMRHEMKSSGGQCVSRG
jgi:GT2 family glycosyltransferase